MTEQIIVAAILSLLMGIVFASLNVPLPLACASALALAVIVFHALDLE
jgi:uncharacterized membrane protein AbrB (regulator of aidB expression)